jgi:hypothetical protein
MHPRTYLALSGACFMTAAGVAIAAIDGPVGRDAEKGDPARWYQPLETPQQQHRNAMQEAAAALAEALKECRASAALRASAGSEAVRDCEAEARAQYEDDVERARGFLVRSTLG